MFESIASPAGFFVLLALFGTGAFGALVAAKRDALANIVGNGFAIAGSLWGLLFAGAILGTGKELAMHTALSNFSFFSLALHIDKLAAFFIGVISLIALLCSIYAVGYVKDYYKRYNIGALGFFYNTFIVGMLLVVTAANGIWFLLAWEVMSLASYFLVVYDRHDRQNIKAGYVYLIMTHAGAACILLALLILAHFTHSFDFAAIKASSQAIPALAGGAAFLLAFVGLGTKAGVIPLHIWLPSAHPAAPSHVSALMSGVMIKTGVYMMIRLFLDVLPLPTWCGVVVLAIGAVSSVIGVLYALTEHDIKRLLAYHSIENIGIILLGLGSAMIFASLHQEALMLLALAAALLHTLNHATFKSLLFLSAGSLIHGTRTRNIEDYGGLLRLMPITGLAFLIGSMAISALPPFNGFFSEWLTFQSLFSGLSAATDGVRWVFLFAIGSLAITGGLALACFVKAFGVAFLARPRTQAAKRAHEAGLSMRAAMLGLAALCLAIGIAAAPVTGVLQTVARELTGTSIASAANTNQAHALAVHEHASSVSGPAVLLLLAAVVLVVWLATRYGVYRRQKVTVGDTWDCGTKLQPRMEITATGFARSITLMFQSILRPTLRHQLEYHQNDNPYLLKSRTVHMVVRDVYQAHLYTPVYQGILAVSRQVKRIQNGNLNAYVLYICAILIVVLVVGA